MCSAALQAWGWLWSIFCCAFLCLVCAETGASRGPGGAKKCPVNENAKYKTPGGCLQGDEGFSLGIAPKKSPKISFAIDLLTHPHPNFRCAWGHKEDFEQNLGVLGWVRIRACCRRQRLLHGRGL